MYLIITLTRNRQEYLSKFIQSLNRNLNYGEYFMIIGDDNTTEFDISSEVKNINCDYLLLTSDKRLGARQNLMRCIDKITRQYDGILFFESDALLCDSAIEVMKRLGKDMEKNIDYVVANYNVYKTTDFTITFTYTNSLQNIFPHTLLDLSFCGVKYPMAWTYGCWCSVSVYLPFSAIDRIKNNAIIYQDFHPDVLDNVILHYTHQFMSQKSLVFHQGIEKRTIYTDETYKLLDDQTKFENTTANWVGQDFDCFSQITEYYHPAFV